MSESSILSQPTRFYKEYIVRKLDLDEVRQFIEAQTPETKIYIGCDSTMLGLNTLNRDAIKSYPNPADDNVLICLTYPTKQPLVQYFIYNGSGQIIKDGLISNCVQLNTSSWKSGIYTFRSRNLTQRIVIQH